MSFAFCGPAVGVNGAKSQQARGRVSLQQSCGVRRNCPWLDVFWGCQWGKEPRPVQGRVSKWYQQEGQHGLCLSPTARDRKGGPDRACEGRGQGGPQRPLSLLFCFTVLRSHCRWTSSATL